MNLIKKLEDQNKQILQQNELKQPVQPVELSKPDLIANKESASNDHENQLSSLQEGLNAPLS